MINTSVDKSDLQVLKQKLSRLDLKKSDKVIYSILQNSTLPIRKAAKLKAKSEIKANSGFTFTRNGTTYNILPRTIEKSIGNIKLKKARVYAVDVGYRTKGKYDGWFAHFVDAGTKSRSSKLGDRGKIEPRNIMKSGEKGIPLTEAKIKKEVLRQIKKLSK